MNQVPQKNDVVRDVTLTHFTLMFGYRIFSLYYPLFLAAQGFTLTQIGQAYLFIYLPIALGAPLAGFLTRAIHPAFMAAAGCLGYAAYALGMFFFDGASLAYLWQIALGLSAAFFFTASRALLMANPGQNAERGFSWFYNAPYWAGAAAPVAGALIIWKFGFGAAFLISAAICVYAALLAAGIFNAPWRFSNGNSLLNDFFSGWNKSIKITFSKKIGIFILLSFVVALVESLVHPFFVLFLKDNVGLDQNQVLQFTAFSAAVFSIFYFFVLKRWQTGEPKTAIKRGGLVAGLATIAYGFLMPLLNFANVFILEFIRGIGGFLSGTGRSALLAKELKGRPSEAGALDTIFSPLSVALGSFAGGYLIQWLGYQWLFLTSGLVVLLFLGLDIISKKTLD